MENCTIYAHFTRPTDVLTVISDFYKKEEIRVLNNNNSWSQITIEDSRNNSKIELFLQQRDVPNYILQEPNDRFEMNLVGMYNFFNSIDCNPLFKDKILAKIASINIGIGINATPNLGYGGISLAIQEITKKLDGIIFTNKNSVFPIKHGNCALLDHNKKVIISDTGYSEINDLNVEIDSKYYFPLNSTQN